MDTGNLAPQPQARPPRSRLTWIWPVITNVVYLSAVGCMLSALIAISKHLPLQIIGSGWWKDGAMGIAGLLFALSGFSRKMSALITSRELGLSRLGSAKSQGFRAEALGLVVFVGYGVLPLCLHWFEPVWILISGWIVYIVYVLMKRKIPRLRTIATGVVTWLDDRNDTDLLVAEPSRLSRRALISGGLILGIGASGLAAVWRALPALPALIPDYTFFGHDNDVNSLSWFPDSLRIASIADNGQCFIWNAADGSNRRRPTTIVSSLTKVQVSPNGKLLTASDVRFLSVVDATTGILLWKKEIGYTGRPFSWAPNSAHVVALSQGTVMIVHATTGEEATTSFMTAENFCPYAVAWSPDGKSIAATDGVHIVIWDAASGVQHQTFTLPHATDYSPSDFSWSPNGDALALAVGRVVYVWLPNSTETTITYREHSDDVPAISWSPDGRYIASCGSEDMTVRIWEAATGKTVFVYNGHFSFVQAVAWSPDGQRIASGGFDNLVHVWRPILPA